MYSFKSQACARKDSAAERALLQCSSALWEIIVLRGRGREPGNSPNHMAGSKQRCQAKSQMERDGEGETQSQAQMPQKKEKKKAVKP